MKTEQSESQPKVRVVVTNYRRPHNVAGILQAFRKQTYPIELVVVDNSGLVDSYTPLFKDLADDVITFNDNAGPASRFIGGVYTDAKYILFQDDDISPAKGVVEGFVRVCEEEGDHVGVMGWLGRIMEWEKVLTGSGFDWRLNNYSKCNVNSKPKYNEPIDFTVRGMFVRSDILWAYHKFKQELRREFPVICEQWLLHDDIMLSVAVRCETDRSVLLRKKLGGHFTPASDKMPSNNSFSGRHDHANDRSQFIRACYSLGWRGIHGKSART